MTTQEWVRASPAVLIAGLVVLMIVLIALDDRKRNR